MDNLSLKQRFMSRQLYCCVSKSDYSLAEDLLLRGAQPDLLFDNEEGSTAIHVAAGINEKLTNLMLQHGANPNVRCSEGRTPLHVAAMYGQCEVVKLLLHNKADPWMADQEGNDCLDYAQQAGCDLCMALIQQAMVEQVQNAPDVGFDSQTSSHNMHKEKHCSSKFRKRRYTEQLQFALNTYDPDVHFIDVTSPDHPQLRCRNEGDQTVLSEQDSASSADTPGVDSHTKESNSSDSYHTCSSGSSPDLKKTASLNVTLTSAIIPLVQQEKQVKTTLSMEISPETELLASHITSSSDSFDLDLNVDEMPTVVTDSEDIQDTLRYSDSDLYINDMRQSCNHVDYRAGGDAGNWMNCRSQANSYRERQRRTLKQPYTKFEEEDEPNLTQKMAQVRIGDHVWSKPTVPEWPISSEPEKTLDESKLDDEINITKYKSPTKLEPGHFFDSGVASLNSHTSLRRSLRLRDPVSDNGVNWSRSDLAVLGPLTSTRNNSLSHSHVQPEELIWTEDSFTLREILFPVSDYEACSQNQSTEGSVCSAICSDETVLYNWKDYLVDSDTASEFSCASLKSVVDVSEDIKAMSNTSVRTALLQLGDAPGPVIPSTRALYECRLAKLRQNPDLILSKDGPGYFSELAKALAGELNYTGLSDTETQMAAPFTTPVPTRVWREGTKKASFNYLLMDPRVTRNLPSRCKTLGEDEAFRVFIRSIFYVGKGARGRPYKHFKEAMHHLNNPISEPGPKVQHILDVWEAGQGVVSLHIFQNVIPEEAYTREACMIDALGVDRLTNKKRGDFYGNAATWSPKKRRLLGVLLLRKAFKIFIQEGERQIEPGDLKSNC